MMMRNWRNRKIEKASPNKFGRIIGQRLPVK
jgi:hypothetical protein